MVAISANAWLDGVVSVIFVCDLIPHHIEKIRSFFSWSCPTVLPSLRKSEWAVTWCSTSSQGWQSTKRMLPRENFTWIGRLELEFSSILPHLVWPSQLAASSSEGCRPNGLTIHSQTCWNIVSHIVDELSNVFLVVVGHCNPDLWYLELCIVTVGSHLRESKSWSSGESSEDKVVKVSQLNKISL